MIKYLLLFLIITALILPLAALSRIELLSSRDVVGYIYHGDLFILDLVSRQEIPCLLSHNVQDFCWDYSGNRIYYLQYDPNSKELEVGCIDFPTGLSEIFLRKHVKPLVGSDVEGGEMLQGKIMLNPDWGLVAELGFGACYVTDNVFYAINVNNKQVRLLDNARDYPLAFAYCYPTYFSTTQDIGSTITLKAEKYNELYLLRNAGTSIQNPANYTRLSHTQDIDRDPIFTEGEFYYAWAPDSSSVVFGFETYSGDLLHGVTLAVNCDGSKQQVLNPFCTLGCDFDFGFTADNGVVFATEEYPPSVVTEAEANSSSTLKAIKYRDQQGNITTVKQFQTDPLSLKYRHPEPTMDGAEFHPRRNLDSIPRLQVMFDEMRLRDSPGLNGKVLTTLNGNDMVEDQGEVSSRTDTVVLGGVTYHSHWYKVRSFDGITGWIYGAAIGR